MTARVVDAAAVRRWAERAAAVSARLEQREVRSDYVPSAKVERFLESIRPKG